MILESTVGSDRYERKQTNKQTKSKIETQKTNGDYGGIVMDYQKCGATMSI
jgi:hypothetical protein